MEAFPYLSTNDVKSLLLNSGFDARNIDSWLGAVVRKSLGPEWECYGCELLGFEYLQVDSKANCHFNAVWFNPQYDAQRTGIIKCWQFITKEPRGLFGQLLL